jgi:hypothetical protein
MRNTKESYEYILKLIDDMPDPSVACRFITRHCNERLERIIGSSSDSFDENTKSIKDYLDGQRDEIERGQHQNEFLGEILNILIGEDWDKITIAEAETLTVVSKRDKRQIESRVQIANMKAEFLEDILKELIGEDSTKMTLAEAETLTVVSEKDTIQVKFLKDILEELVGPDWGDLTLDVAKTLTVIPKKEKVIDIALRDGYAYEIIEETESDIAVMAHFENEIKSNSTLKLWWNKEMCDIFRKCRIQTPTDNVRFT